MHHDTAAPYASPGSLTGRYWRWPRSPQSVLRMPAPPCSIAASTAAEQLPTMFVNRPRIESQLDVPGQSQNGSPGAGEHRGATGEVEVGVVAPLADRDAVGDAADELGTRAEDVTPHEQLAAVDLRQRAQLRDPREIVVDLIGAELPRLVEADVDPATREVGKQLREPRAHERERLGIARIERRGDRCSPNVDDSLRAPARDRDSGRAAATVRRGRGSSGSGPARRGARGSSGRGRGSRRRSAGSRRATPLRDRERRTCAPCRAAPG